MNKRSAESLADENACSFFLEKKKRLCRMKKAEGKIYCPHHSHLGSDIDEKKGRRIPCPYDPSHFCYESKIQKHLKICNAREKSLPDYFVHNINAGEVIECDEKKVSLNNVSDDQLMNTIKKIKELYKETNINISKNDCLHPLLEQEMKKIDDGFNNFKHMKQQASLLYLLNSQGFLSDGSCFIEFGAGKGQLMYWIVQCVPKKEACSFILIDRSAQRHKSDNKFAGTDIQMERIKIDIQHLHLGKVKSVQPNIQKVIGVSKHLCGCATDLALRCLTNTLEIEEEEKKIHYRPLGFIMALCCHHRCTWNSYTGKEFMQSKNITEDDFRIMTCIASWATCGERKIVVRIMEKEEQKDNEHIVDKEIIDTEVPSQTEAFNNRYAKMNLTHEERELIGQQCKMLIDFGRIHYLLKLNYQAQLVSYVDTSTSLENIALVAFNKKDDV